MMIHIFHTFLLFEYHPMMRYFVTKLYFFDMYLVIIGQYELSIFSNIRTLSTQTTEEEFEHQDEVTKELLEPETITNLGNLDDIDCDLGDLDCLDEVSEEDILVALKKYSKKHVGPTAPAHGLVLEKIIY